MSLTSNLKNLESPVYKFLLDWFPDVKALSKETRAKLKNAPLINPPDNAPYGTLGHAFELRVRQLFTNYNSEIAVPTHLEKFLDLCPLGWTLNDLFQDRAIRHFKAEIKKFDAQAMDAEREDRLIRFCFAFAWLEELFRGGSNVTTYSPLIKQSPKSLKALLAMPNSELVEDIRRMVDRFEKQCGDWIQDSVIMNPTFEGSKDVGGADADLIIGNRLVDLKTVKTIKADRFRRWVYQLVGYALLDYRDEYKISELSIYFARHGVRINWPFPGVLSRLSQKPLPPLELIRRKFRNVVVRTRKAKESE